MAENNELTTIQTDTETRDFLKELAAADFRSMGSELRWLVAQERARRQQLTLPPEVAPVSAAEGK